MSAEPRVIIPRAAKTPVDYCATKISFSTENRRVAKKRSGIKSDRSCRPKRQSVGESVPVVDISSDEESDIVILDRRVPSPAVQQPVAQQPVPNSISNTPVGFRLNGRIENHLVTKFQQYGERSLTQTEITHLAESVAVSAKEREMIIDWLHFWIPKLTARVAERKQLQQVVDAPSDTEIVMLSTCFGTDQPVDLPEGLTLDLKMWTTGDVLKFVDHVITPLNNYCAKHDKEVITKRGIDGSILYELAVDNGLEYEKYGFSPRAYVSLKFRCRHLLNTFNGFL